MSVGVEKREKDELTLTQREELLLRFIRRLGWGDLKIRVENGQPVVIYEAIRTFKLEEDVACDIPLRESEASRRPVAYRANDNLRRSAYR